MFSKLQIKTHRIAKDYGPGCNCIESFFKNLILLQAYNISSSLSKDKKILSQCLVNFVFHLLSIHSFFLFNLRNSMQFLSPTIYKKTFTNATSRQKTLIVEIIIFHLIYYTFLQLIYILHNGQKLFRQYVVYRGANYIAVFCG